MSAGLGQEGRDRDLGRGRARFLHFGHVAHTAERAEGSEHHGRPLTARGDLFDAELDRFAEPADPAALSPLDEHPHRHAGIERREETVGLLDAVAGHVSGPRSARGRGPARPAR